MNTIKSLTTNSDMQVILSKALPENNLIPFLCKLHSVMSYHMFWRSVCQNINKIMTDNIYSNDTEKKISEENP